MGLWSSASVSSVLRINSHMRATSFWNRHLRPPVLSDALNTWRGLFEPSEKVCKAVFSSLVPLRVEISANGPHYLPSTTKTNTTTNPNLPKSHSARLNCYIYQNTKKRAGISAVSCKFSASVFALRFRIYFHYFTIFYKHSKTKSQIRLGHI